MYTIRFPDDKPFTGEYLSVTFKEGEGQTVSDYLAERFARKGLEVEKEPKPEKEQKKAAAAARKAAAKSAGDPDAKDSD